MNTHRENIQSKKTPLIFVPGLFGSMSNVIIPGTGDWSFGVAGMVYEPFIALLETMGYKLNENLFIAFYDWRKGCEYSAKEYLFNTIKHAKTQTHSEKVNIVCHSMGGLVSRAYVQSDYYQNDVEKLIVLATPSTGSPPNFSYWTGGELPDNTTSKTNVVRLYMTIYLWLLGAMYKNNKIEAIHEHFPSLGEILPSKQYGDYLYYSKNDNIMEFKPQSEMKTQNPFLDKLNENINLIKERNIDVTVVAGVGEDTVQFLQIVDSNYQNQWIDGTVVGLKTITDGDGNAILNSVFYLEGKQFIVHGSHIEMLYKSEPILRKELM